MIRINAANAGTDPFLEQQPVGDTLPIRPLRSTVMGTHRSALHRWGAAQFTGGAVGMTESASLASRRGSMGAGLKARAEAPD